MTSSTFIQENGFGLAETTPVADQEGGAGGGRQTTFSQRIAWRNTNTNNTVVTPAASAVETTTPVTPAAAAATEAPTPVATDHTDYDHHNPYESILQDARKWKRQLESARDEVYFLQVQNAMHLDYLTMAGADE
jgi:uncharacterized lipoprotein YddW (UPF0748 family)